MSYILQEFYINISNISIYIYISRVHCSILAKTMVNYFEAAQKLLLTTNQVKSALIIIITVSREIIVSNYAILILF